MAAFGGLAPGEARPKAARCDHKSTRGPPEHRSRAHELSSAKPHSLTGVRGELWGVIGGRTNDGEQVIHLLSAATLIETVYELAADGQLIFGNLCVATSSSLGF